VRLKVDENLDRRGAELLRQAGHEVATVPEHMFEGENVMEQSAWDIRREGRRWTQEEFDRRIYQAPEKIEFAGGIFASEHERLTVLAMLLENLGIDKAVRFGKLEDWKAAIADLEKQQGSTSG
jgi:hypothetical protein